MGRYFEGIRTFQEAAVRFFDVVRAKLKGNVGSWDRFIRVLIGVGLLTMTVIGPKTGWGWVGILPLLTGIVGWCPPYQILGISTCEKKNPEKNCINCR